MIETKKVTLLEVLDRTLNKGVVLSGDLFISVADVDLIFLGLKIFLSSVQTAEKMQMGYGKIKGYEGISETSSHSALTTSPYPEIDIPRLQDKEIKTPDTPEKVEHGLARLVLTIVELIRQLIEKQALRRIKAGSLTDVEIERLGETLMRLENKMEELKKVFGLNDDDLNLNLGPLGELM